MEHNFVKVIVFFFHWTNNFFRQTFEKTNCSFYWKNDFNEQKSRWKMNDIIENKRHNFVELLKKQKKWVVLERWTNEMKKTKTKCIVGVLGLLVQNSSNSVRASIFYRLNYKCMCINTKLYLYILQRSRQIWESIKWISCI